MMIDRILLAGGVVLIGILAGRLIPEPLAPPLDGSPGRGGHTQLYPKFKIQD
jgi:hypothetical protein